MASRWGSRRTGGRDQPGSKHVNEIPPEVSRIVLLKTGRVLADGAKADVLTGARLSELYDTRVAVLEREGHFVALPDS